MVIKAAINGYGRIGRNILRALYESGRRNRIQIVAVNDPGNIDINGYLTEYDSVQGQFPGTVEVSGNSLIVNGDAIQFLSEPDPTKLPWKPLNIDIVYECTGLFTSGDKAKAHIASGASRVLISAPATGVDATVVFGVNNHALNNKQHIVSNASCTTNCLAPLAKLLHDAVGIEQGMITTVHAFTNDQSLSDNYHKDPYRARSATQSIIPTTTGAAAAIGKILPELDGKLDGLAVRVPTINVSLLDLSFVTSSKTSVNGINGAVKNALGQYPPGVIKINEAPRVSIDFNHDSTSCVFDATQTKVIGKMVKVLAWYDNEWAFSHRMLDNTLSWTDNTHR